MSDVPRKRGQPPKALEAAWADQAASDLVSIQDVWVRVETAKRQHPSLSRDRICGLLVQQAKRAKKRAPKRYKEVLASQKYLFNRDSLRRLYYRANALVQSDPRLAEYCEREVKHRLKQS